MDATQVRLNPETGQREVMFFQPMTDEQINSENDAAQKRLEAAQTAWNAADKELSEAKANAAFHAARKDNWDRAGQVPQSEAEPEGGEPADSSAGEGAEPSEQGGSRAYDEEDGLDGEQLELESAGPVSVPVTAA